MDERDQLSTLIDSLAPFLMLVISIEFEIINLTLFLSLLYYANLICSGAIYSPSKKQMIFIEVETIPKRAHQ